jgi:hypothetical protein
MEYICMAGATEFSGHFSRGPVAESTAAENVTIDDFQRLAPLDRPDHSMDTNSRR